VEIRNSPSWWFASHIFQRHFKEIGIEKLLFVLKPHRLKQSQEQRLTDVKNALNKKIKKIKIKEYE